MKNSIIIIFTLIGIMACKKEIPNFSEDGIKNFTNYIEPYVEFSFPDRAYANKDISFQIAKEDKVKAYHWDFGDGYTSDERTPKHNYVLDQGSPSQTKLVRLTVTSITGDKKTIEKNILIDVFNPTQIIPSIPSFDVLDGFNSNMDYFVPKLLLFNNTSFGSFTKFEWDFGDGTPIATGFNPAHFYERAGVFTVKLLAYKIGTNIPLTFTKQVRINPKPINIKVEYINLIRFPEKKNSNEYWDNMYGNSIESNPDIQFSIGTILETNQKFSNIDSRYLININNNNLPFIFPLIDTSTIVFSIYEQYPGRGDFDNVRAYVQLFDRDDDVRKLREMSAPERNELTRPILELFDYDPNFTKKLSFSSNNCELELYIKWQ